VWTSNATDLALKGVLSLQMKISAGLTRSCYVVIVLMSHSNGNPGICWLHPVLQSVEIIDDHCLAKTELVVLQYYVQNGQAAAHYVLVKVSREPIRVRAR
jgi:hypothetical protein